MTILPPEGTSLWFGFLGDFFNCETWWNSFSSMTNSLLQRTGEHNWSLHPPNHLCIFNRTKWMKRVVPINAEQIVQETLSRILLWGKNHLWNANQMREEVFSRDVHPQSKQEPLRKLLYWGLSSEQVVESIRRLLYQNTIHEVLVNLCSLGNCEEQFKISVRLQKTWSHMKRSRSTKLEFCSMEKLKRKTRQGNSSKRFCSSQYALNWEKKWSKWAHPKHSETSKVYPKNTKIPRTQWRNQDIT